MKGDEGLPIKAPGATWDADLGSVAEQFRHLTRAQERMQALLDAVLAVSRELELPVVLRQIVNAATPGCPSTSSAAPWPTTTPATATTTSPFSSYAFRPPALWRTRLVRG